MFKNLLRGVLIKEKMLCSYKNAVKANIIRHT